MDGRPGGLGALAFGGCSVAYIQKKDGKHTVCWRDSARRGHRRDCPDLATARRLKLEIEQTQALGRDWEPRDDAAAPGLQAIAQAFLEDRARVLAPATIVQRKVGLELFLRYLRGRYPRRGLGVDLLTRSELAGFFTFLTDVRDNTPLSASQRVKMISSFWEWAADHDDYAHVVGRPRRIDLPDASPELKTAAPTWAQCDAAIAEASRSWAPWWARYLAVMRFTGLRKNQAMRLTWEDLDLDAGTLRIRPELGKSKQERRGRVVPVSRHLVSLVAGWGAREGFLIQTRGRMRRIDNETLHRIWSATGAPAEAWRQPCHAFRKCFVSRLIEAGVAEHVVKGLVGHSRGTTGDVYTEAAAMMPLMRAAVDLIPEIGASNVVSMHAASHSDPAARIRGASVGKTRTS